MPVRARPPILIADQTIAEAGGSHDLRGPWQDFGMLIIAGWLQVQADHRESYLAVANEASRLARAATGCLEFVQAPDPLVPGRIIILERWESDTDLMAFRESGSDENPAVLPDVLDADVKRYLIATVGPA